jgi:hypothetical protein
MLRLPAQDPEPGDAWRRRPWFPDVWRAALGVMLAGPLLFVIAFVFLAGQAFLALFTRDVDLIDITWRVPAFAVGTLALAGMFGGYTLILKRGGISRPLLFCLLLLGTAGLLGAPIAAAGSAMRVWGLAAFALPAFVFVLVVLRLNAGGRPLRWRLPAAVWGYLLIAVLLAFGPTTLELRGLQSQAEERYTALGVAVLGTASQEEGPGEVQHIIEHDDGVELDYREEGLAALSVRVRTYAEGVDAAAEICGPQGADCEERGEVLVVGGTQASTVLVEVEGRDVEISSVTRDSDAPPAEVDLVRLAEEAHPASPEEVTQLAAVHAEQEVYGGRWPATSSPARWVLR